MKFSWKSCVDLTIVGFIFTFFKESHSFAIYIYYYRSLLSHQILSTFFDWLLFCKENVLLVERLALILIVHLLPSLYFFPKNNFIVRPYNQLKVFSKCFYNCHIYLLPLFCCFVELYGVFQFTDTFCHLHIF